MIVLSLKYIAVIVSTGFCCVHFTHGVVVVVVLALVLVLVLVLVVVVVVVVDVVLQAFFGFGGGMVSKNNRSPGSRVFTVWP